jgi:hypothetical protein
MNESNPATAPVPPPVQPTHKDRSTGLIIFGILTMLLGCLAGLMVLVMLAGQAMAAKATNTPSNLASIVPAAGVYGVMAVALVWLGIGSMMARRWARALLLVFSWAWLALGLLAIVMMAYLMPKMLAAMPAEGTNGQAMPPAAKDMVMVVMFIVFGVMFILLPAVWIFFYRSPHVKATCEQRDPVTRWTDTCPLPVLGLSLLGMFSVPMMLLMPLTGHIVMPFFGMFLTGLPGAMFGLAIAAVWGYASWSLYRLKPQGWWLFLIAIFVFTASGLLTFARHDVVEMYTLMGYPDAQIEQIKKTGLLAGNNMAWVSVFSLMPFLGYLLFIKKYFRGKEPAGAG